MIDLHTTQGGPYEIWNKNSRYMRSQKNNVEMRILGQRIIGVTSFLPFRCLTRFLWQHDKINGIKYFGVNWYYRGGLEKGKTKIILM